MSNTATLDALRARQQATWASGDYARIGTTLQIVGETLCEALDLRPGRRVLDVAAGNGNATLAAARRFCEVTSTDYVPSLLAGGEARARAEGQSVSFVEAAAESLPFPDGSFDYVLSTFGVMFASNHARAGRELVRVCRKGGAIGLANWTPGGFVGQLFKVVGRHVPPLPGAVSPSRWGTDEGLQVYLGPDVVFTSRAQTYVFRYPSAARFVEMFRRWYGPVLKAFEVLPPEGRVALEADLLALLSASNRSGDETLVVPSEYLEVRAVRR